MNVPPVATNFILNYGNNYIVSNADLVKFGLDDTKKMAPAKAGSVKSSLPVNSVILTLDHYSFMTNIDSIIFILYGKKKKRKIKVCRKSGNILSKETTDNLEHIIKFDESTIPNEAEAHYSEVGFWIQKDSTIIYSSPKDK